MSAGIPYTLLLKIEPIGFATFGLLPVELKPRASFSNLLTKLLTSSQVNDLSTGAACQKAFLVFLDLRFRAF